VFNLFFNKVLTGFSFTMIDKIDPEKIKKIFKSFLAETLMPSKGRVSRKILKRRSLSTAPLKTISSKRRSLSKSFKFSFEKTRDELDDAQNFFTRKILLHFVEQYNRFAARDYIQISDTIFERIDKLNLYLNSISEGLGEIKITLRISTILLRDNLLQVGDIQWRLNKIRRARSVPKKRKILRKIAFSREKGPRQHMMERKVLVREAGRGETDSLHISLSKSKIAESFNQDHSVEVGVQQFMGLAKLAIISIIKKNHPDQAAIFDKRQYDSTQAVRPGYRTEAEQQKFNELMGFYYQFAADGNINFEEVDFTALLWEQRGKASSADTEYHSKAYVEAKLMLTFAGNLVKTAAGHNFDTLRAPLRQEEGDLACAYLYAMRKNKIYVDFGKVKHSAIASGRSVQCAGFIGAENGRVTVLGNGSGHYIPNWYNLLQAVKYVKGDGDPGNNAFRDDAVISLNPGMINDKPPVYRLYFPVDSYLELGAKNFPMGDTLDLICNYIRDMRVNWADPAEPDDGFTQAILGQAVPRKLARYFGKHIRKTIFTRESYPVYPGDVYPWAEAVQELCTGLYKKDIPFAAVQWIGFLSVWYTTPVTKPVLGGRGRPSGRRVARVAPHKPVADLFNNWKTYTSRAKHSRLLDKMTNIDKNIGICVTFFPKILRFSTSDPRQLTQVFNMRLTGRNLVTIVRNKRAIKADCRKAVTALQFIRENIDNMNTSRREELSRRFILDYENNIESIKDCLDRGIAIIQRIISSIETIESSYLAPLMYLNTIKASDGVYL